jgi:hypothetical protein
MGAVESMCQEESQIHQLEIPASIAQGLEFNLKVFYF